MCSESQQIVFITQWKHLSDIDASETIIFSQLMLVFW